MYMYVFVFELRISTVDSFGGFVILKPLFFGASGFSVEQPLDVRSTGIQEKHKKSLKFSITVHSRKLQCSCFLDRSVENSSSQSSLSRFLPQNRIKLEELLEQLE